MTVNIYIYYRVGAQADTGRARDAVRTLQAALLRRTGIAGRLLVRCDDARTWMEIYEQVPDRAAFESVQAAEAAAAGVVAFIEPGAVRHVECFRCV